MFKKILLSVLVTIIFHAVSAQSSTGINISEEMNRLEKEMIADTITYKGWNNVMRLPGLLANKYSGDVKYLYIFNHPQQYKDSLLSYIQNPVYSWEHKYYMLGLLQGMPVSEYSPVLSTVYDVVKNQIKENIADTSKMQTASAYPYIDVMMLAINQENLSREVQKNSHHPALKKLLEEMRNDALLPRQIKLRINWLLNGAKKKPIDAKLQSKLPEQKKEKILFEGE